VGFVNNLPSPQHYSLFKKKKKKFRLGFVKGSPHSIFLVFSQFYIEYDLQKNKIIVPFFVNILIFMSSYLGFNALKLVFEFKTKIKSERLTL
jgi:hypothetical protein